MGPCQATKSTSSTKAPKAKAKRKAKAKPKNASKAKRGREEDGHEPGGNSNEVFSAEFTDCLGNVRLTLFGDDLINAVNFTLERCNVKSIKRDVVQFAIDLGVIFAVTGKVEAIAPLNFSKANVWTKCRIQIKHYLNRVHSLQARTSDPELPQLGGAEAVGEGGEAEDEEEEEQDGSLADLVNVVKAVSEKNMLAFLDDNFARMAEDKRPSEIPTVNQVLENQPGMIKTVNKMKRFVKTKFGTMFPFVESSGAEMKEVPSRDNLVQILLSELVEVVNGIFDPGYMEVVASLLRMKEALQEENNRHLASHRPGYYCCSCSYLCNLYIVDL